MSIAFDNKGNSGAQTTSPVSFSFTVGSLTNGILVVTLSYKYTSAPSGIAVSYGGNALAKVRGDSVTGSSTEVTEVWYLKNPATGAANVQVSWTGTVLQMSVGVASFNGVDQTSPIDAQAGNNNASASSLTVSLTTVAASTAVVSVSGLAASGTSTITQPSSYTSIYAISSANLGATSEYKTGVSAGAQSITWTKPPINSPGPLAGSAISLNPASSTQTLTATGISSDEAEGTGQVNLTVVGVGAASVEADGAGTVFAAIFGQGIVTLEACGIGLVVPAPITIVGSGVPSPLDGPGSSAGKGSISFLIVGTGVQSEEALGIADLMYLTGIGIPTEESLGVGSVQVAAIQVVGSGIPTGEAEGVANLIFATIIVSQGGVPSTEALGLATVTNTGSFYRPKPYIEITGPARLLSDQQVADLAGVDVKAVTAFSNSIPDWYLKQTYRAVAAAFGVDEKQLKALINKSERIVWGRTEPVDGFAGIR